MRRVLSRLQVVIASALMWTAASALAQLPPAQLRALKEINDYAEQLCTTVGASGRATQWKTSGEATAGLRGLSRFLADLGFKISAEVSDQTTSGVLQKDLARLLEEKGNCKLRVFLVLNSSMLSPAETPSQHREPPAPSAPDAPASPAQRLPVQGAPKDLGALGFPSLQFGMSIQDFAAKKPQAMEIKAEVDASGRTSVFYDGVQEHAQLRGLVDGRVTMEFRSTDARGISTPGALSSARYYSGSYYSFNAFQTEKTSFQGNPELNCADSTFESVIVAFIARYGLPSARERTPASTRGADLVIPMGVENPCSTAGACFRGDDAKLNFRENVSWYPEGMLVNANRHLMGSTIYAYGAPILIVLDCEIRIDIKPR